MANEPEDKKNNTRAIFCPNFDFYNEDEGSLCQQENSLFMLVLSEQVLLRMITVQFNLPQQPSFKSFSVRQSSDCISMTLKKNPKTQQEGKVHFLVCKKKKCAIRSWWLSR